MNGANVNQSIEKMRAELSRVVLERDEEIHGLLVAALAGENVALIGPPGTAKSLTTRAFAALLGARYFEILMTRFTVPEEVFGPMKLSALQQDRFERNLAGRLADVEVAFLDEVFKASSSILNTMLPVLNERVLHDGGAAIKTPLRMVVGASNEYPTDPELGALWDRFAVRFAVSPLRERANRMALALGTTSGIPRASAMTLADWDAARVEVAKVTVDDDIAGALIDVCDQLAGKSVAVTDRTVVKATGLLRAVAWVDGSGCVEREHMGFLRHVLWSAPDQQPTIAAVLKRFGDPVFTEAKERFDAVMEMVKLMIAGSDSDSKYRAMSEIQRCGKLIREKRKTLKDTSKSAAKVDALLSELVKVHSGLRDELAKPMLEG